MPRGTAVPSGGALPAWLDNSMTFPLPPPLEKCSGRSVCGDDRQLPRLPHEKSSSFSLTNTMFFYCFRATERSCSLGGKTRAESWENVCLKRRKEDFREAMRQ